MPTIDQTKTITLHDDAGVPYKVHENTERLLELLRCDEFSDASNIVADPDDQQRRVRYLRTTTSAERFLGAAEEIAKLSTYRPDPEWAGGTAATFAKRAFDPDSEAVEASEILLDAIDAEIRADIEAHRAHMISSPSGGIPNVPAYLRGAPNSMRRRVHDVHDSDATRIFVQMNSASTASAAALRRRGIASLAVARALQSVRPVELIAVASSSAWMPYKMTRLNSGVLIRLGVAPFDVSTASRILADPAAPRCVGYRITELRAGNAGKVYDGLPAVVRGAEFCGATDRDLYVPRLNHADVDYFEDDTRSVAWAAAKVRELLQRGAAEDAGPVFAEDPWQRKMGR